MTRNEQKHSVYLKAETPGNRAPAIDAPLPTSLVTELNPRQSSINALFASIAPDLQGLNAWRYQRQISSGIQEHVEAISFQHYLETGKIISFDEMEAKLNHPTTKTRGKTGKASGSRHEEKQLETEARRTVVLEEGDVKKGVKSEQVEAQGDRKEKEEEEDDENEQSQSRIQLTPDDYILGLYDLTGELMRYAITGLATKGTLPSSSSSAPSINPSSPSPLPSCPSPPPPPSTSNLTPPSTNRNMLTDLRTLRTHFESLDVSPKSAGASLGREVDKKTDVMRTCVEKVEMAVYGLIVRGAERPKGWMPDYPSGGAGAEMVESY